MSTTEISGGAPPTPESIPSRQRMIATVGALLALALASIDVSVVATALPKIAEDLDGLALYAWVGVSYAVAAAVVVPIAGKLGDMFGRKPFLLVGLTGFILMSFLCGMAQNMAQLVISRGVQGLFGGILMASIFTLVADIYPAEKRPQIMGVFMSVAGLSMVIGPLMGGIITDVWDWRWVFYVNVPIGLLAIAAVAVAVPIAKATATWRGIDFLGVLTLVAGLVPILVALSLPGGGGLAWNSPIVLLLLVGGFIMLVVFFLVETRVADNPILPFGLFRNNQVAVMVVVAFFSAFAMMGAIFYVPLLYQGVLGVSATYAGSLIIPLTLALMIVPVFAGKALSAIPRYRYLGTFSFALMVAGLFLLSTVAPGSGPIVPILAMALIGVGIGIAFPMASTVVQSAVPMEQVGVATSQIQFWRMIAGPVALAVLGSILTTGTGAGSGAGSPENLSGALHSLFLVAAAIVAVGLVATLFLREIPLRDMSQMMKSMKDKKPEGDGKPAPAESEAEAARTS